MNKRAIRWLYSELPRLVSHGVVTADAAEQIRRHYGDAEGRSGRTIALTVCSILGALLVGAGVILLLAHNWEAIPRPARTVLALAPLLVCQALGLWVIRAGKQSAAWREGVATAQTLAIGAAIALVGQTYHIPGDPGSFLLIWSILALPLVYVLGAAVPCLFYFVGITSWAGYMQSVGGHATAYWLLLAASLPYLWLEGRRNPYSARSAGLGWALALCLCVGTGISLEKVLPGLWVVVYAGLFSALYLAGRRWAGDAPLFTQRPFHTVGAIGTAVFVLMLTFEWPWDDVGWYHYRYASRFHSSAAVVDYLLAFLLPAASSVLLASAVRRRQGLRTAYGALPVVTVVAYGLACWMESEAPAMILFNVYAATLGIWTLAAGIRSLRMGMVNGGMAVLTTLIVARFFDMDMGFVARGIAFILIGIGFLGTNIVLVRRSKGVAS